VLVARTIQGLLDKIYFTSGSEAEKGSRFEKLIVAYLQTAGQYADDLVGSLRLMRGYCVKFLDRVGASEDPSDHQGAKRHLFREPSGRMYDYFVGEALGELRSGVGFQVAIIAAAYGLDVEDALAATLPPAATDDN
jgi:hypothetical protein